MMPQPVIDLPAFEEIKASMGPDFIGEIVAAYCAETPLLLARLQQAFAEVDHETFRMIAHSIKSSSSSLGALPFAQTARELEALGKAKNLSAEASAGVQALLAAYPFVAQALRALCHD